MIQGSYCARLEFEPLASGRVRGGCQRKNLHGYIAFQPPVARTIHLAHAIGSDNREDLIRPQTSSRSEVHERLTIVSWQTSYLDRERTTRHPEVDQATSGQILPEWHSVYQRRG